MRARLKSKWHAPNIHACIIYIRVNILSVCILRMRTQIHTGVNLHIYVLKSTPGFDQM